jgi:hypothetical protein
MGREKEEEDKEIKEVGGTFFCYFRYKIRVRTEVPSVTWNKFHFSNSVQTGPNCR